MTTAKIAAVSPKTSKTYDFGFSGSVLRFDGFLKVYEVLEDKKDDDDESSNKLPNLDNVKALDLEKLADEQHFTSPPPRFNEASLVKVLEERGIGRPSTYASIINTIQDREYVTKIRGRFYPTEIGMVVCDLLVKNFPYIFDTAYTAKLEEELDDIEDGKEKWTDLLNGFYGHFEEELKDAGKNMEDIKRMEEGDRREMRAVRIASVAEVGQVRQLLCVFGLQQERPDELHVHQGKHAGKPDMNTPEAQEAGRDTEEYCDNCGRVMVLQARDALRSMFMSCPGYNERSAVQDDPQAEPEAAAEAEHTAADGRRLPGLRQAAGAAAGRLWRICFVLGLSQVQVREAEPD